MRHPLGVFAAVVCATALTPASGGWVVTTMEDVPEYLVAGEPVTLTFTLREHGSSLLSGREPTVILRAPGAGWLGRRVRATAEDLGRGRYAATVTPRDRGLAEITVDADFMRNQIRLLPLPVLAAGVRPASLTDYDRGRRLFVAKGCVTCHLKRDDPALTDYRTISIGPDLTGRRFPTAYLIAQLNNPAGNRTRTGPGAAMPDLGLRPAEIAALERYINGEARVQASR